MAAVGLIVKSVLSPGDITTMTQVAASARVSLSWSASTAETDGHWSLAGHPVQDFAHSSCCRGR